MAARKPIIRIGIQETDFVDRFFNEKFGGQNWVFEPFRGYFMRRPGYVKVGPPLNERSLGTLSTSLGSIFGGETPAGVFALISFRTPAALVGTGILNGVSFDATAAIVARRNVELLAGGQFLWRLADFRLYANGWGVVGYSQVELSPYWDGTKERISFKAYSASNLPPTTALVDAGSSWRNIFAAITVGTSVENFGQLDFPLYLPPIQDVVRSKDLRAVSPAPSFFSFAQNWVRTATSSVALGGVITDTPFSFVGRDSWPLPTSAVVGDACYFAGGYGPTMKFDGSRISAAGAGNFSAVPASASLVAGGVLTGSYQYKFVRRTYTSSGAYAEGQVSLATPAVTPAGQKIQLTVASSSTTNQAFLPLPTTTNSVNYGAVSASLLPSYKTTNFTVPVAGTYSSTSSMPLRKMLGTVAVTHDYTPGEPFFQWNGTVLTKLFNSGSSFSGAPFGANSDTVIVASAITSASTDTFCAGDVVVILRTVAGGTLYYELQEVPATLFSVAGAVFLDNIADATLLTQTQYLDTPYIRGAPPAVTSCITSHQQRIVVAGSQLVADPRLPIRAPLDTVFWSEPFTEHFPPANSISLAGRCTNITGLASINDVLYIFTDRGLFAVTGKLVDPTTFTLIKVTDSLRCASPSSVVAVDGAVWCMTTEGSIAKVSGFEVKFYDYLVDTSLRYTDGQGPRYRPEYSRAILENEGRKLYFTLPFGSLYSSDFAAAFFPNSLPTYADTLNADAAESLMFLYDFRTETIHKFTGIDASKGLVSYEGDGGIYIAKTTATDTSQIYCLADGHPDDGRAIPLKIITPFEDAGSPHLHKTFGRLTTFGPEATGEFTLGVQVERDWDERRYVQQFNQVFRSGEGYANEAYASDPYGDGVIPDRVQDLNNFKAKALRLTFNHNNAAENPIISGYVLEYSDTTHEGREE